jgi:hypothetical protein
MDALGNFGKLGQSGCVKWKRSLSKIPIGEVQEVNDETQQ